MNVRFSVGEVRLRLERAEAEAVARGEAAAQEVALPGGRMGWRVEPGPSPDPTVELRGTTLVVAVSGARIGELLGHTKLTELGVVAVVQVEGAAPVRLAVELDALSGKRR
jgi:hypothetical protein